MNPFIEISILTPSLAPGEAYKVRTPFVTGNGFNPVFNSSAQIPFSVPSDMLDLAFIRLEVFSKTGNGNSTSDEVSLGKYTVSATVFQPGYRHVPLYDHLGQQYLFSSLLVYTQLQKQ